MGRRSSFSRAASLPFDPSTTNLGILIRRTGIWLGQDQFEVTKKKFQKGNYLKEQIFSFKVIVHNDLLPAHLSLITEQKTCTIAGPYLTRVPLGLITPGGSHSSRLQALIPSAVDIDAWGISSHVFRMAGSGL